MQAYVPTLMLHSYLVFRVLQSNASTQTLKQTTSIVGVSFDLIPLSIGIRSFFFYAYWRLVDLHVPLLHLLPGSVEFLLITYFAIRYTRSIYAQRWRIEMGIKMDDDEPVPVASLGSGETQSRPSTIPHDQQPIDWPIEPPFYRPSIFTLIISMDLSVACAYIEFLEEPNCGLPMIALVYAPTVILHLYLLQPQWRGPNTTFRMLRKSAHYSFQLANLWITSQVFYLFVWPHIRKSNARVMNP
ncbi:hypothetical protein BDN70DRAFT_56623 [Pholiota conissans]|uniref:Uncharacterized protein n=1 Tax=Pholiota conissans TaxID=109636 RepID=A0A9P6D6M4_9AGAR|nr:hypothetical protein BDN70DRAFT_56623 [Pholiota conissans]